MVTPAPVRIPTQQPLVPSFGCKVRPRAFHLVFVCYLFKEPWTRTKKALSYSYGGDQLLSGSLANGRLFLVSRRLGRELFTLPSYIFIEHTIIRQALVPIYRSTDKVTNNTQFKKVNSAYEISSRFY